MNNLNSLNNKLFEQLDRLTNKNLSGDKLQEELERTDAIVDISRTIISNADLMLNCGCHSSCWL